MVSGVSFDGHDPSITWYRAKRATQLDTPSKTPVSISQSLSALRLAHAKLLEEHGANVALLRRREADLTDAQDRDVEKEEALEGLQREKRVLLDKIAHMERDAALAEREVGFLQALNVRRDLPFRAPLFSDAGISGKLLRRTERPRCGQH